MHSQNLPHPFLSYCSSLYKRSEEKHKDKKALLLEKTFAIYYSFSYIKNILPADKIINLYTPEVCGKEKRKKAPSKAGLLGVEGTDAEKLREVLRPYSDGGEPTGGARVTKAELYALGLCGGKNSAEKRKALLREFSLPQTLSANAMLEAVSLTVSPEKWEEAISKISAKEWQKDEVSE